MLRSEQALNIAYETDDEQFIEPSAGVAFFCGGSKTSYIYCTSPCQTQSHPHAFFADLPFLNHSSFKEKTMKKNWLLTVAVIVMATVFGYTQVNSQAAAGSSKFTIASDEYSVLSEKAINYVASFNFDAWAEMLADDVVFVFPDGDVDTRTTLKGKQAVLDWWRNWHKNSGIKSMSMSEFNHIPFEANGQLKGGAQPGTYNISYFSSNQEYSNGTVKLRMNFVTHFNKERKIDGYHTYYDRSKIIEAAGKNVLKK